MESLAYNLSEAFICFVPIFLIIGLIGGALLWNSWPPSKRPGSDDSQKGSKE